MSKESTVLEKLSQFKLDYAKYHNIELPDSRLANMAGYSASALSAYQKGTYRGDVAKLERALVNMMEREYEKMNANIKTFFIPFRNTSIAKTIWQTIRTAHLNGVMAMIYGDSGLGKSTAAKEYAKEFEDAIYIEANKSYTAKILFKKLHKMIGYSGEGSLNTLVDDVIEKLKNSKRALIIDQAEDLNNTALQLIRTVFDHAGIGIILLGLQDLFNNVRGQRHEFEQFYTRITVTVKLKKLKSDDIHKLVTAVLGENEHEKTFEHYAGGNAMILRNLLFNSLQFAEKNEQLNAEIIHQASLCAVDTLAS